MTSTHAARAILDHYGLYDVHVEEVKGFLSGNYDPRSKVLRLSPDVSRSASTRPLASPPTKRATPYNTPRATRPLQFRTAIVPAVQFGSFLGPLLFLAGFFLQAVSGFGFNLALVGLALFALTAIFSIATLPVEFDASTGPRKNWWR